MDGPTRAIVAELCRREAAFVVAAVARVVRDVGRAEELAQDAFLAALEQWPARGVPDRPAAWLITTARNRALNAVRDARRARDKAPALAADAEIESPDDVEAQMDDAIGDDVLRLFFVACHPVLPREAQVALTLRLLGGLSTAEIARAFLCAEPTIAQRLVRAKKALADAQVPFELPPAGELGGRLGAVLQVVYLVFNEGYAASSGDALLRPALVEEALRLGRLLARIAPLEPEALGLLALMALQASRDATRVDADGDPVLLEHQDRTRWDRARIDEGLAALAVANRLGGAGPYVLQARIAACHARAPTFAATEFSAIAAHYATLLALVPTPVVALNHAVAVSRAEGPAAALPLLDRLAQEPALARYPFLPAARADVLERLGRLDEARAAFEAAAALAENERQRARLLTRAARLR